MQRSDRAPRGRPTLAMPLVSAYPVGTRPAGVVLASALVAVSGLLIGAARPAALFAQEASPADRAAVVATVDAYHRALASGDSATALDLLALDAVVLEGGGLETREEYRAHHLPGDMRFAAAVTRERGDVRVEIRGEVAWAVSTNVTTGRVGEREIHSRGAELMVLVREGGGWKIGAVHWSSRGRGG